MLDAFPMPERSINGLAAEHTAQTAWPGQLWRQSIRVDHAIASNALLFVRYGHTFSEGRAGYVQVNEARFRSTGVTIGLLNALGPRVTSEARIGMSATAVDSNWQALGLGGAQPFDLAALLSSGARGGRSVYALSIPGFGQFVSADWGRSRQSHWNAVETLAISAGSHQLRFGVDYQRLMPERIARNLRVHRRLQVVVGGGKRCATADQSDVCACRVQRYRDIFRVYPGHLARQSATEPHLRSQMGTDTGAQL